MTLSAQFQAVQCIVPATLPRHGQSIRNVSRDQVQICGQRINSNLGRVTSKMIRHQLSKGTPLCSSSDIEKGTRGRGPLPGPRAGNGAAENGDMAEPYSRVAQNPLARLAEESTYGPIELPPRDEEYDPLAEAFKIPEVSPLQTAASVLLTGALTLVLARSFKRRSQRAKEMRFRSNAVERLSPQKVDKYGLAIEEEEAKPAEEARPPPSVLNTFGGAVVAGGIAVVLYKFSTTVDATFAAQNVSQAYSVRNITITVR
eukprot:jgi/Mesen1/2081/ME000151S01348